MPTTKAQQKAVHAYIKRNYTRLEITIPREQEEALKAHAAARGYSVNGLVNLLLRRDMGLNSIEWKSGDMNHPDIEAPIPEVLDEIHLTEDKYYFVEIFCRGYDAVKAIDEEVGKLLGRDESGILPFNPSRELYSIGRIDDPEKRAAMAGELVKEVRRLLDRDA